MTLQILCLDDRAIPSCLTVLSTQAIDIGRDPHCDIRLLDTACSRFHARITYDRKQRALSLRDNSSSNGTWVHNKKISSQILSHNDQFRCGDIQFIVLDSEASDNETRVLSDSGNAIALSHSLKARPWKNGDDPKQLTLIHHICQSLHNASATERAAILAKSVEKILQCSHVAIYMHGQIRAGALGLRLAQRLAASDGAKLYVLGKDLHGQTIASQSVGSALSVDLDKNSKIIATRHIAHDPFSDQDLQLLSRLAPDVAEYFRNPHQENDIDLIGNSAHMQALRCRIQRIASSDTTVLVTGESGSGKEIVASSIHKLSGRHLGPMICVNCAAISGSLFEAELFGHEKGAFTGADHARQGKIRAAHGGTLFLDEIGEMSLEAQAKLLRVLQDHRVQAVGAESDVQVDVRIIAATNRDLQEMVAHKTFREDLLYRLDVLRIHTIGLDQHPEDIPAIADFLLRRIAADEGRPAPTISSSCLKALCSHLWPGNVRQLENTLRRALVFADDTITTEDLELHQRGSTTPTMPTMPTTPTTQANNEVFLSLAELEAQHIVTALVRCNGNKSQAAKLLGISRPTIHKKIGDYGLDSDNKR